MQSQHPFKVMLPALFAIIIDAMGFGLVYPVMTALFTTQAAGILPKTASANIHHFYLGLAFLLYPACMFFGSAIMSDLSDQFGRKRVLTFCMLGIALSFLLMGLGASYLSLVFLLTGRALSGLMAGSQPIAQAMIGDISTKENKARNMSFVTFAYCAGVVLGPLLGGFLSDRSLFSGFSFALPFYVAAGLSFLAMLCVSTFLTETVAANKTQRISIARPFMLFIDAMSHQKIRYLSLIFLLNQIGFSLYFQFIVVHMRLAFHYSNWQLGAFNSMLGIGFGLGLIVLLPLLTKMLSTSNLASITYFTTAFCLILCALLPWANVQWLLAIIIASFNIVAFTASLTLFSDSVQSTQQGWAMGIANAMMALAWTLTGFSSNLLTMIASVQLILIGGLIYLVSSTLLLLK